MMAITPGIPPAGPFSSSVTRTRQSRKNKLSLRSQAAPIGAAKAAEPLSRGHAHPVHLPSCLADTGHSAFRRSGVLIITFLQSPLALPLSVTGIGAEFQPPCAGISRPF